MIFSIPPKYQHHLGISYGPIHPILSSTHNPFFTSFLTFLTFLITFLIAHVKQHIPRFTSLRFFLILLPLEHTRYYTRMEPEQPPRLLFRQREKLFSPFFLIYPPLFRTDDDTRSVVHSIYCLARQPNGISDIPHTLLSSRYFPSISLPAAYKNTRLQECFVYQIHLLVHLHP